MNLVTIAPGVLRLETDMFDEEEEVRYNPASFLYFDNKEFVTVDEFVAFVKGLLLRYSRQRYKDIETSVDISEGVNALSIASFVNPVTKFTLNIPERSGIIEIEREYILLSIYKSGNNIIFQQPIQTFKQLIFYTTSYF